MDWIDMRIEYFKKKIKSLSLKETLGVYILIAVVAVIVCFISTVIICKSWKGLIYSKYEEDHVNMGNQLLFYSFNLNSKDKILINVISFIQSSSVLVYSIAAILILSHFYYKNKLQEPLYLISQQSKYISRDDLSFSCSYESGDEMGEVCKAFDKMRIRLIENQKNIWNLMEEQRRINSAFAHDLRTPLTVIKGYNELLIRYYSEGKISNEKLIEILSLTNNQVNRLIDFSETMKDLNSFEGILANKTKSKISSLIEDINEISKGLSSIHGIPIDIKSNITETEFYFDGKLILQVVDNLLSNALRYSKSKIEISIEESNDMLLMFVKDDGKGFSKEELKMASKPYYSDENSSSEHFGLGLTICKVLCEKHGGGIYLSNSIHGGAIVCVEFFIL